MNTTALIPGSVAVVTGGASGLGLAAATRFCEMGLSVCIADLDPGRIAAAVTAIRRGSAAPAEVLGLQADVSRVDEVRALEQEVRKRFGRVNVLMNNAGIGSSSTALGPHENWERLLSVNLWGVINGCQAFLPGMLQHGFPGLVINTGSKQGITTPPGNPAYNVSKAGVKAYTEALQHELRNTPGAVISAHLFIPGFVDTGISGTVRAQKPPGAWTAGQTVDFCCSGSPLTIFTFCVLTTTSTGRWTCAASPGRRRTSRKTARPCRAGMRITPTHSRHSSPPSSRA
jgi:NAD(P)-dependent dehydrogenase (short-subunit alcohol dehydrogenase family)